MAFSSLLRVPAAVATSPAVTATSQSSDDPSFYSKRLLIKQPVTGRNSRLSSSKYSSSGSGLLSHGICGLRSFPKPLNPGVHQPSYHSLPQVSREIAVSAEDDEKAKQVWDFANAFWKFLRPHTLYGTVLASCSLAARAWILNPHLLTWSILPKAISGFLALLCANSYIVGINQIYDVDIDKVNKPYLPIAAGEISIKQAWVMVTYFFGLGLSLVTLNSGPLLTSLYCLGLLLGTIYTVPPFRMKRFPVAAFLFIALARGFLINFGVYYASRSVLGLSFQWSSSVAFITIFVSLFALVIALSKDLSDVEGDRKYKISTFATKLGVRKMTFLGSGILLLNYVVSILASIYMPQGFRRSILIPTHAIMAISLVFQTRVLEQAKYTKEAISEFYMFLWKLFYAEYLVFPFI